jgi:hypothetical protein
MKTATTDFFKFAIVIFFILLAGHQCQQRKSAEAHASQSLRSLRDSIHHRTLKDGTRIAEKRSTELSQKDFEKAVLKSRDSVRQLKERIGSLAHLTRSLRVELAEKDTIRAPIHDTVLIVRHDTVRAGKVRYQDRWLSLDGLLLNDSLRLSYGLRADLDIATYWKSDGLLKPKYLVVNILSRNPHLAVTGIEDFHIRPKQRFFETNAFHLAIGFAAGLFIPR